MSARLFLWPALCVLITAVIWSVLCGLFISSESVAMFGGMIVGGVAFAVPFAVLIERETS